MDKIEGYQPNKGKLDPKNPPKGGSGVIEKDDIGKSMEFMKISKCKKGDIIIVELKKEITAGLAMYLESILTKKFPDNKSLVLCNGAKLYPLPKKILNSMGWYQRKKSKQ